MHVLSSIGFLTGAKIKIKNFETVRTSSPNFLKIIKTLGQVLKQKKFEKLVISCDGGAASGKTTGAKLISKKYKLKFLSSGMLYRYAGYLLLKNNQNDEIKFLKKKFKKINLNKISKMNLNTQNISEYTSKIAKIKKIRNILKALSNIIRKKT